MNNLDFLQGFQLEAVEIPTPGKGGSTGPRLQKTPNEDADLRIFKNGRVYPSAAFAASFDLEFQAKKEAIDPISGSVTTTVLGNGLDFIHSTKWVMTKSLTQQVLFLGITPREGNGKLDALGSCSYDDNGAPKKSIMDAGAYTAVKEQVIPMLTEVFGINWEVTPHVDLKVVLDMPMVSPNGFYIIPKVVARGELKGQASFARRETTNIFPMILVDAPVKKAEVKEEEVADISAQFAGDSAEQITETRTEEVEIPNSPGPIDHAPVQNDVQEVAEHPVATQEAAEPVAKNNILDSLV